MAKFILNAGTMVVHDAEHLKEECNTDDIAQKEFSDDLAESLNAGYKECDHCLPEEGEPSNPEG